MVVKVMKVSSKGQATLSREVRKVPVKDVGGSLKEYAGTSPMPFHRAREKAWGDVRTREQKSLTCSFEAGERD